MYPVSLSINLALDIIYNFWIYKGVLMYITILHRVISWNKNWFFMPGTNEINIVTSILIHHLANFLRNISSWKYIFIIQEDIVPGELLIRPIFRPSDMTTKVIFGRIMPLWIIIFLSRKLIVCRNSSPLHNPHHKI